MFEVSGEAIATPVIMLTARGHVADRVSACWGR
jgi:DNA-binding response OmpR family regulator